MTDYNDGGPFSIADALMHFEYDAASGAVTTKTRRRNLAAGQRVGTLDRQGYLVTSLFRKPVKLHRLAWALAYHKWPSALIDHRNGIKSDNRLCNLREVTNAQNKQNLAKSAANTSGHLGVSFHKKSGKWVASIKSNGRSRHLGLFSTPEDASSVYRAAKLEFHQFGEVAQ